MGYKYTVVWYTGYTTVEAHGTSYLLEALWLLLTKKVQGYHWKALEVR